jgi:hypothetical protein
MLDAIAIVTLHVTVRSFCSIHCTADKCQSSTLMLAPSMGTTLFVSCSWGLWEPCMMVGDFQILWHSFHSYRENVMILCTHRKNISMREV